MKKLLLLSVLIFGTTIFAQSPVGEWDTYSDEDGIKQSTVEIYKVGDKLYGKIVYIYNESKRNDVCDNCTGANKDKPIMGMVIIDGLEKEGVEWGSGKVFDPTKNKYYDCKIWLEGNDTLKLRGYVGWFYRTQTWKKKL